MKILSGRKKVLIVNSVLVAVLFGLISLNKELIRPSVANSQILSALTGCFPNFIAAFLISLAFVNASLIRKVDKAQLKVYAGSIIVFVILAIEELNPLFGASTHFDKLDILASGLGSFLAILTYSFIAKKRV